VENCQVGVYASLGCGVRATLVDFRLFLPEAWAKDAGRCAKAKMPEDKRVHRTKPELALAMIAVTRARGSTHRWVGADEVYGNSYAFPSGLEDMDETFMVDVACKARVWESGPCPPAPTTSAGQPKRSRRRAQPKAKGAKAVRVDRLAYMQAQRFWIECCFQDAKSELGMAQYEVRGWTGWHHHMALICLALLFMLKERCLAKTHTPLLSARDLVELLALYLPRRPRSEAEVLRQMQQRHAARQRDLDNRRRRLRRNRRKNPIRV
jgi:SRSO17 transposase